MKHLFLVLLILFVSVLTGFVQAETNVLTIERHIQQTDNLIKKLGEVKAKRSAVEQEISEARIAETAEKSKIHPMIDKLMGLSLEAAITEDKIQGKIRGFIKFSAEDQKKYRPDINRIILEMRPS